MSLLDEIAQKRSAGLEAKKALGLHSDTLQATLNSGNSIVEATKNLASKEDIDQLLAEFKQFGSHLIDGFGAISDAFNKQPDIPRLLADMHKSLSEVVKQLDSSEQNTSQIQVLEDIKVILSKLSEAEAATKDSSVQSQAELISTLKAIDVKPVVNLPESVINLPKPEVVIKEKKIDFKPLQDTLSKLIDKPEPVTTIDLSCYKAQDISESGKKQYIGSVNPDGQWYIIENDTQKNKLRYLFGNNDYTEAFQKAASYEYSLLNEAIDALST